MVSIDTMEAVVLNQESKRIESEADIQAYLDKLCYALNNNAIITFQQKRGSDSKKNFRVTNIYTIGELFPNDNPVEALRNELKKLTVQEYIETVKDNRFLNKPEMRVFGRQYPGFGDVYIKIRVELVNAQIFGNHTIFEMSFHFAEHKFKKEDFSFRKG